VHQPIIIAVAYVVVQWQAGVAVKAATIFVVSAIATVASTELLRRLPVVGNVVAPGSPPPTAAGLTMRLAAGMRARTAHERAAHRAP
jgi:hypothetical protein